MKIMKKITLLFVICIGLLIGCKKEAGPVTKTENPAKATVDSKITVDTLQIRNTGNWEFGQKFYVSRNGNITKLGCKLAATGTFKVSLWDYATSSLIITVPITVADTTQFTYSSITSIAVTANTRYVISVNNTSAGINKPYYVYYKKPGLGSIAYPFTTGSITYETGLYKGAAPAPVFPDVTGTDGFWGIPDIQFEYTE
mgnify:FL=1